MDRKPLNQIEICKYIIKLSSQVILINLVYSIIYWIIFSNKDSYTEIMMYWLDYILMPFVITSSFTYLAHIVVKSDKYSMVVKKYFVIILMILIAAVLTTINRNVMTLILGFMVPIFVSTLFSDLKLTTMTYILSQILLLVSAVLMHFYAERDYGMYLYSETLVASGMLLVSFLMSRVLIQFNESSIRSLDIMYSEKMALEGKVNLDALTGLYNRRSFDVHLSNTFDAAKNKNTYLALAIIDIDDFKDINDTHGHANGDQVLTNLARNLIMHQSEFIHAFRIGGDEFAIIFEGNDTLNNPADVQNTLEHIKRIFSDELKSNMYSISCGIAILEQSMEDTKALFKAADTALYDAKGSGKNKINMYVNKL